MSNGGVDPRRGVSFPPAPYPLALIVCDATFEDPATGKRTIIGAFSYLQTRSFPAVCPVLGVYAVLTEGRGTVPVELKIIDAIEEREPLVYASVEAVFVDPRQTIELDFHFVAVVFPLPGEYRAQLFSRGEILIERRIVVIQSKGAYL